ncbi:MAG: flagellar export chaperone FliS [Desulfobacterota bacterium]|nr:flagellar export chaperone FliS [Thermodesulfobacteriota bacterium]
MGIGYQAYERSKLLTSDPKRLVLLCYEEAVRSLEEARARYLCEDYEAKARAVQKALDLLNHLREALDFEKGGEIARNLDRLYGFMIAHLLKSDQRKDVKGIDQVSKMLQELKWAWEEAFRQVPALSEEERVLSSPLPGVSIR